MKRFMSICGLGAAMAMPLPVLAGALAPVPEEPQVAAPAPVAAPMARDWTGFYAGGQLGYIDLARTADGDGALGGFHAGYLQDFGNGFAAGVEGSFGWANGVNVSVGGTPTGTSLSQVARLGARAGVITNDFFIYGTAGAARARIPALGTETGPFGGIGVEYAITDNLRVGGEVLYHDFGSSFGGSGISAGATTAQARVSFRF